MKKWLIIAAAFLALIIALVLVIKRNGEINKKWETAMGNIKAYDLELSAAQEKNTAYKLTIDQLEYFKDSILLKLDSTRKELHIKDGQLQALQYISSHFTKRDTIIVSTTDTIFKDPSFAMDTLIGDKWYNVRVGLKYPAMVAISPTFVSEKHVVVSSKKETVNPPKKFFLFRWFQKKHRVLHIDVIEKNPYVKNEKSKYVEIIK